jgi:hypothetical protein
MNASDPVNVGGGGLNLDGTKLSSLHSCCYERLGCLAGRSGDQAFWCVVSS